MGFDFSLVFHAVESVLTFFIIGCIGYFLAKRGWFSKESNFLIARLITLVALPLYLVYNINSIMTKQELMTLAYGLVVPFSSIVINLIACVAISRAMKIPDSRIGVFRSSFAFSNTIYIGLPVNLALFGEMALPYVLLYYFGNTCFFWTIGNYFLATDNPENRTSIFTKGSLKNIFSPSLCGLFVGLLLLSFDLKLPVFIANSFRMLGSLTTPLVIISVGVTLHDLGLHRIRIDREILMIIFGRFVFSPLIVVGVSYLFPIPDLMRQVFIIQSSLPVMSSVAMLANFYRSDVDYATVSVSSTTILSLVTIPVFMVLVSYYL